MIRLQRVTLLALHQYLGLGAELIASQHRGSKNLKYRVERSESQTTESDQPYQPSALQLQITSKNETTRSRTLTLSRSSTFSCEPCCRSEGSMDAPKGRTDGP